MRKNFLFLMFSLFLFMSSSTGFASSSLFYEKGNPAFAPDAVKESFYAFEAGYSYSRFMVTQQDEPWMTQHRVQFSEPDSRNQGLFLRTGNWVFGLSPFFSAQFYHVKGENSYEKSDWSHAESGKLLLAFQASWFHFGAEGWFERAEIQSDLNQKKSYQAQNILYRGGLGFNLGKRMTLGLYYQNFYDLESSQFFPEKKSSRFFSPYPVIFGLYQDSLFITHRLDYGYSLKGDLVIVPKNNPSQTLIFSDPEAPTHFADLAGELKLPFGKIFFEAWGLMTRQKVKLDFTDSSVPVNAKSNLKSEWDFIGALLEIHLASIIFEPKHELFFSLGISLLPYSRIQDTNMIYEYNGSAYNSTAKKVSLSVTKDRLFTTLCYQSPALAFQFSGEYFRGRVKYTDLSTVPTDLTDTSQKFYEGAQILGGWEKFFEVWSIFQNAEISFLRYPGDYRFDCYASSLGLGYSGKSFSLKTAYGFSYTHDYFKNPEIYEHSLTISGKILF